MAIQYCAKVKIRRKGIVDQGQEVGPTKQISLRDVVSITTGRSFTKPQRKNGNRIGTYCDALEWMTGSERYVNSKGRFEDKCRLFLYEKFPQLKAFEQELPALDVKLANAADPDGIINAWLAETSKRIGVGQFLQVPKLPIDAHGEKARVKKARVVELAAVVVEPKTKKGVCGPEGGGVIATGAEAGSTVALTQKALSERLNARIGGLSFQDVTALEYVLDASNLPSTTLMPAILAGTVGLSAEEARRKAAECVALALNSPNAFAATRVPVREPDDPEARALIDHYVQVGMLTRAHDGKLYALFRNPLVSGTNPQHNRCLGVDLPGQGSFMAKGTGLCMPHRFRLPKGSKKCEVQVVVFRDRETKKPFHEYKGALTKTQASNNVGENYQRLAKSLQAALDDAELRPLLRKHSLTEEIIPHKVLTLEIEAIPVAPLTEKAKQALAQIVPRPFKVDTKLAQEFPGLVWIPAEKYCAVFDTKPTTFDNETEPFTVQLYASAHPALRLGSMDIMNQRVETLAAPALNWDTKYTWAEATVTIGWWERFFNDYGWTLRHDEKSGRIRVYDLTKDTILTQNGDARAASLAAARTIAEGTAIKNGLFLRALWNAKLGSSASGGGWPTDLRNSNPRCVLDLDTLGPYDTPRDNMSPAGVLTLGIMLTEEQSHQEDLDPRRSPCSGPRYHLAMVQRLLGILDGVVDITQLEDLMLRVATHQ